VFYQRLLAWRWLPESRTRPGPASASAPDPARRPVFKVIWEVLSTPRGDVPRLIWIYAVGMLGFNSMNAVLALYLNAQFGVTENTVGIVFFYLGALSLVMRALVLGKLIERFGETGVMRIGSMMMALGLALLPVPHFIVGLALVIAMVPISTALLFPAHFSAGDPSGAETRVGQVMGVQQSFGGIARVVAPIWATAAFQGLGTGCRSLSPAGSSRWSVYWRSGSGRRTRWWRRQRR